MKIARVQIDGYRLLDGFVMDLRDNLSLVIGKNNTGKTSLLNVLDLYLTESNPKFAFEDFSIPIQVNLLTALADGSPDELDTSALISLELEIAYDESDNLRNLSHLMVDLAPEARTVNLRFATEISREGFSLLHAAVHANLQAIEDVMENPLGRQEVKSEIQNFLSKNLGKYLTHQVVSLDPNDAEATLDLSKDRELVQRVLRIEHVSARRSVENRTNKGSKTSGRALSRLSNEYFNNHTGDKENSSAFIRLAAQAAATDRSFTTTYKTVFEDVVEKIKRFGAGAGFTGDIQVVSNIQPNALLTDSTSVMYGHHDSLLPEDHNGLGYLNLIAIIMEIEIRLLRMRNHTESGPADINILAIEEPEAHTHPQLQYIFIKQIKNLLEDHKSQDSLQLQTIITTHSSHITAESDFRDIKYFKREKDRVEARNMTDLEKKYGTDSDQYHFLTQYLTLTRAELFFADKAVLIEGDTERLLLRAMMRKIDEQAPSEQTALGSQNISVVEIGAHSQVFDYFIEFTGLKTLIITDIDSGRVVQGKRHTHIESCPVSEGTHTSNYALTHYLGLTKSGFKDEGDLSDLRNRRYEEKMLTKNGNRWVVDTQDPLLFLAYQTEEEDYEARSYEDAFIHINRDFITSNIEDFRGLKHRAKFSDSSVSSFELADTCVQKKTHFALDVIFLEQAKENQKWKVPAYINEGLRWLRDV